eukprot:TRINITY_DN6764_c0_g4_i2.p1 TRINITY_DN6764_c0_g4~~TRINITY_DN6764_c0_g4_i2.p1  ORF type:complete len:381 (-),score=59.10 TRINITY_DN6764_c0_g4_i2:177-1235(-)
MAPLDVETLLSLSQRADFFSKENFRNPVTTPCKILAEDGIWCGDCQAAKTVQNFVEQQLLEYVRNVTSCPSLDVAQALIRKYEPRHRLDHRMHVDHNAFATAILDLTPRNDSGLYVGEEKTIENSTVHENVDDVETVKTVASEADFFFYVPFRDPGDVCVHSWNVPHGIRLHEDHSRISIVIWMKPSADIKTGINSWYAEPAWAGDEEAAYRVGVEAWKQKTLGTAKGLILEAVLDRSFSKHQDLKALLKGLGGTMYSEKWCRRVMDAVNSSRPDNLLELLEDAEKQSQGKMLQGLVSKSNVVNATTLTKSANERLRGAARAGWYDAQTELPALPELPSADELLEKWLQTRK